MNVPDEQGSKETLALSHWVMMGCWILIIFSIGNKPVHLDEANFLAMTQGDFWKPHLIQINWEGVEQSAFDVLSNPPGMVWLLWPVKNLSIGWMRLWILPWSFLAIWGMWRCTEYSSGSKQNLWLMLCSPIFVLSHNSLMPEMPLLACILVGWQGILWGQRSFLWALLLGCAALFRYSGLTMIPLLMAWVWFRKPTEGWKLLLAVCLPTILLYVHDMWVYGQWHFWHMLSFQQEQQSWSAIVHKLCALSSMLVLGGGILPNFRRRSGFVWGGLSLCVLMTGLLSASLTLEMSILAWFSVPLGFFCIGSFIYDSVKSRQFWLMCWLVGGFAFLLGLRFAATRYWLPFIVPYWLLMHSDKSKRYWVAIMGVISMHLAWDDAKLAQSQHNLAKQTVALCQTQYGERTGYFAGHWGWQYVLERHDWLPVEDDEKIPNSVCFSFSKSSWPQEVVNDCFDSTVKLQANYKNIGLPLRVHTIDGLANYHSYMISNRPPISTITPFGWGYDDWDQVELRRSCRR